MTRLHYKSGERTFLINTTIDLGEYYHVTDKDTKVVFKLPKYVVHKDMKYIFSWNRYHEERDNAKALAVLEAELKRLENSPVMSPGITKGMEDMKRFMAEVKEGR